MRLLKLALLCPVLGMICALASVAHVEPRSTAIEQWIDGTGPYPAPRYGTVIFQRRGWPESWIVDRLTPDDRGRPERHREFRGLALLFDAGLYALGLFTVGTFAWARVRRPHEALPPWASIGLAMLVAPAIVGPVSLGVLFLGWALASLLPASVFSALDEPFSFLALLSVAGTATAYGSIAVLGPPLSTLLYRMHRFRRDLWILIGVNVPALPLCLALATDTRIDSELTALTAVACLSGAACGWAFWWIATRASPEVLAASSREAMD